MDQGCIVAEVDRQKIEELIPHRPPFLLLDRVVDVVPDHRATGIKYFSGSEYFFHGHFPGYPVVPAVLIIEAMAQTANVLGGYTIGSDCRSLMYFAGVDRARFRSPVVPGDTLEVRIVKQRRHTSVWRFSGEAYVDAKLVAEASFTAVNMGRSSALAEAAVAPALSGVNSDNTCRSPAPAL
jgi:3-hydroxyacyl-[acyl-carrier-protein] dehydratase